LWISSSVAPVEHRRDRLLARAPHRPPEVGLEDLPDVHAARHAQRVEQDVDGVPVVQERHVLLGHDAGDDALVPVPAGHLVADASCRLVAT
jgi:hypothetical protein